MISVTNLVQPSPDAATYNLSLLRNVRSREGTERLVQSLYKAASGDISRQLSWLSFESRREIGSDDIRLALADIAVRCVEDVLIAIMESDFEKRIPNAQQRRRREKNTGRIGKEKELPDHHHLVAH